MVSDIPNAPRRPDAATLKAAGLHSTLSAFVHEHVGIPAVIIGGGISRSAQVAQCPTPAEAIYISANDHGLAKWRCHYAFCLDMIEARIRKYDAPLISTKRFGEIRVFDQRVHQSGMMAVYAAWAMGCTPILLAGMDCWVGGVYEDDHDAASTGKRVDLQHHLTAWRHLRAVVTGDVRSLGGPLVDNDIFPLHDPAKGGTDPETKDNIYSEVAGMIVRFTSEVRATPLLYSPGDVVEIHHNDLHRWGNSMDIIGDAKKDHALLALARPARRREAP